MALIGPRITGDASVTGIVDTIRSQSALASVSETFTVKPKEAETYLVGTGMNAPVAVLPNAQTDLKPGSTFVIVNESTALLTVMLNDATTMFGSIPVDQTGLFILTSAGTTNGVWHLVLLDSDSGKVTKDVQMFNATIGSATGNWGADSGGANSITFTPVGVSNPPIIQVFDLKDTANPEEVLIKTTQNATTSQVTISVPAIANATFAGKIVFL